MKPRNGTTDAGVSVKLKFASQSPLVSTRTVRFDSALAAITPGSLPMVLLVDWNTDWLSS